MRRAPRGWIAAQAFALQSRSHRRSKRWFSVRHALWIDWDAGYGLHEPAWKADAAAAPERRAEAKAQLRRDEAAVIARVEAQPVDSDHSRLQDVQRLYALGVTSSAVVLAADDTGRSVDGVPMARFDLELEDGRRVSLEQAVPPRSRKLYVVGSRITVYGDPQNPDAFALG